MDPRALQIRDMILQAAYRTGHGHLPTSFSIIECLLAAYGVMQFDPAQPDWEGRDYFILSKGHASLAHFATLAHLGFIPSQELDSFGQLDSRLGCHADQSKVPGVEVSTGSLGHGIGVAAGIALGLKAKGMKNRVFVLVGDGESNEGSVWEAAQVASHNALSNLVVIFDDNKSQTRCLPTTNPADKFKAFGFETRLADGHDIESMTAALAPGKDKPVAVIADTRKGYGCTTLEQDMFAWHRRSPNGEEIKMLLEELHASAV